MVAYKKGREGGPPLLKLKRMYEDFEKQDIGLDHPVTIALIVLAILVGFIIPYFYLKNRRIISLKKENENEK